MIVFYRMIRAHILKICLSDFMLLVCFFCFFVKTDSCQSSIVVECSMDYSSVVKNLIQFTVIVSSLEYSLYVLILSCWLETWLYLPALSWACSPCITAICLSDLIGWSFLTFGAKWKSFILTVITSLFNADHVTFFDSKNFSDNWRVGSTQDSYFALKGQFSCSFESRKLLKYLSKQTETQYPKL